MKRKTRTLLTLALSAQMIFSLAACGSKKGGNTAGNANADVSSGSGSGIVNTGSSDARIVSEDDPYYNVTASPLKADFNRDKKIQFSDIGSHYIVGDRILGAVIVQYEMPQEEFDKLLKLDLDDDQQMQEYLRIENEYEDISLQMFDLNGEYIGRLDIDPESNFIGAYPGKDGEILIVTSVLDLKDCRAVPKVSVFSPSGEKLRDINISINDDLYDVQIYVLENGNMLLSSIGKFWILDSEGKALFEESDPELNGTVLHSGGKWFAVMPTYTANGIEIYVREIDTDNGKLVGAPIKSSDMVYHAMQGEQDCFIVNANGIEKFDVAAKTTTQVLAWKDTDVNSETLSLEGARIASENDMVFFQQDIIDDGGRGSMDLKSQGASLTNVVHLSKAEKNPHAGKTRLKLGIDGDISSTFLQEVLEYNKDPQNPARIEILDYTANVDYEDTNALIATQDQLIMDMLSGKGPDILVGYSELTRFNTDSMLVDLNPLLDADSTVSRDELYDNILRSFESDGKLYTIPLTYSLEGMVINSSLQGAKENWTFSDFDQMASSLSPEVQPMATSTPDDLLKVWMKNLSSHFIDDQNKTVDFESEEFRTLLETVKKYGISGKQALNPATDFSPIGPDDSLEHGDYLFQKNMVASCYIDLSDLETYAYMSREKDGRKVAFTGVPSLSGMGMTAKGHLSMAVSASCSDPDIAWQFIRSFLNEENQQELSFNTDTLPVNKNAFQKNCQTEIDVNRIFLEGLKKDAARTSPEVMENAVELTNEHVSAMDALILSVSASQSQDNDIMNIILEESAGFFAGQRTVDDVCKNIQNRATLVVQER